MDEKQVHYILENMPVNDADDYTIKLKEFVIDYDMINNQSILYDIVTSQDTLEIRFSAFYSLKIIYREFGNYSKLIELVDSYGAPFRNIKLYDIVLSTYYRNKVILGEKEWGHSAIKYAELACVSCPTNLAIKHHYSEIIAWMLEENLDVSVEEIDKAIDRLDDVISVYKKHAKYYCTRGRLLAAKGEYELAGKSINTALGLETASDKDSMIRIGQYNYYLSRVHMLENNLELDEKIKNFDEEREESDSKIKALIENVEDMKTRYLEYLAFFSSVLAFIMVTINVAIKVEEFNKAVGLILVLAGALVITFILFRIILPYTSHDRFVMIKLVICLVVAVILILIGVGTGNGLLNPLINSFINR